MIATLTPALRTGELVGGSDAVAGRDAEILARCAALSLLGDWPTQGAAPSRYPAR